MELVISDAAIKWFKDEVGIKSGDHVKFHARYGGASPIQKGFSLGFSKEEAPVNIAASTTADGILFFVDESDLWYFDGHDLFVEYNEQYDEVEYIYKKS
ncbi:MAG TPA: HesB/YadR/YfhF family protein [Bacillus sp. (in: firmicutes)]|uniref:HesB/YadR/YfhF family protein n=1 Tax=Bacillus litorisediminis TaxID=2922713 RepID=UPI001FAC8596|nr:HesB/YadR/YfhF family protein [Bacillus litorisediminis]HWO77569.1 HesB/YadR/YfhF family protein [Bacillus sp. (in: firmicutes)]